MISSIIVEDEVKSKNALKMLLEENCPEVKVVATSGSVDEAVKKITTYKPDLIFMDISMPLLNGIEATRVIRSDKGHRSGVPIVALTAFAKPEQSETYHGICW